MFSPDAKRVSNCHSRVLLKSESVNSNCCVARASSGQALYLRRAAPVSSVQGDRESRGSKASVTINRLSSCLVESTMTALPLQPLSSLDLWDSTQRAAALRLVRRIVKDADESEDVVQDVFFRVSQMEKGALLLSNRAWMTRVLVNSSINALRGRKRRSVLLLLPSVLPCPEKQTGHKQVLAQVQQAMQTLSSQHQRMLQLRDFDGLSYPEMAALMGIPEGTVKSGLSRARAALNHALQGVRRTLDTDCDWGG